MNQNNRDVDQKHHTGCEIQRGNESGTFPFQLPLKMGKLYGGVAN